MLLIVHSNAGGVSNDSGRSHKVLVRRAPDVEASAIADILSVPGATLLSSLQDVSGQRPVHQNDRQPSGFRETLKRKTVSLTPPWKKARRVPPTPGSSTPFSTSTTETITPLQTLTLPTPPPSAVADIQELCLFLEDSATMKGTLPDEDDRRFELTKHVQTRSSTMPLRMTLHELLDAFRKQVNLRFPRPARFQMAAHVASALLQTNQSPWLLEGWTKHSFYVLVNLDTRELESSHTFVSRSFPTDPVESTTPQSVDMAHQCLRRIGIMIMELIYGYNIEDSQPYLLISQSGSPVQDLHLASARMWQCNLTSDSGPRVAEAVLKCLTDFGFGQSPCLGNPNFRKAVYAQVVEPLANYMENWDVGAREQAQ
jgi:hypothetical protein